MKKYIFLLLFTALSFGQDSNQMITFTAAQSLGFALNPGQSHVTSNQCMTKSEALAKYNLSTSAMDGYASNQLVPRSTWVSGVVGNSHNISYSESSSVSIACENKEITNMGAMVYTSEPGLGNGVVVYNYSNLTGPLDGSNLFRVLGIDRQYIGRISNTGVISEYQICNPPVYYTYNITQGYISPNQVDATCGEDPRGDVIVYSSNSSISLPMNFYTNTYLTNSFNGGGFKYYHANTTELLTVSSTGSVTSVAGCTDTVPPAQPTSLTGSINGNNDVTLTWTASTDNVGVTGYKIYRNGELLYLIQNVTTYIINNECGGTHNYSIEAFDAAGNVSTPSSQSNSIYSSNPDQCF